MRGTSEELLCIEKKNPHEPSMKRALTKGIIMEDFYRVLVLIFLVYVFQRILEKR